MRPLLTAALLLCPAFSQSTEKPTAEALEFFETRIRPLLAKSCYQCHSSESKFVSGGLALDTRAGIRRGGNSGPAVIPGNMEESPLLKAVRHEGRRMPPSGKLPDSAIADLEKWIAMGAPDPREGQALSIESKIDIEKGREYWAFQPPSKPAPATRLRNSAWSSHPIDRLLLARMEAKGLRPAPDADRATWLRRVSFDIAGLPPTPEELDAFLADKTKTAYEKVVDRLLASERYGERWGRHWLDVARYAESVGRGRNYAMPYAWRYRDYVIDSFNRDKPYDRFVLEQLAGDLLPAADDAARNEQLVATGFLALGSHDLIEINPATFQMDVVDEMINVTSRSFLGLTIGCARCHDHKFDPIPTADYYAMAGIFRSTEILSGLQRRPRDNVSYFNLNLLSKLSLTPAGPSPALLTDPEKIAQWEDLNRRIDQARTGILPADASTGKKQRTPQQQLRQEMTRLLQEADRFPLPRDLAMAVREHKRIADCEIHVKGDVKQLGQTVPRGFVQVAAPPAERGFEIPPTASGRLQLARWIARPANPLTARVMANRVWLHLMGRGIVPTVDNFGKMGEQPTHRELLDYLALRFVEQGWSTKKLVREIALSRAYRMSPAPSEANEKIDPDNNYYWRQNRIRLEVEALRDSMLLVAGRLDLNRPAESPVMNFRRGFDIGRGIGTKPEDYAVTMRNRSVYVPVVRAFLPAMYETFDFPEPSETKGRRESTTVPTQALFLVNSPWVMDLAKAAADRVLEADAPIRDRIARAYRIALARSATPQEIEQALAFLDAMQSSKSVSSDEKTAWARLMQALFASAEFRYKG